MSLRFIIKRREDNSYGAVQEWFKTIELDVPELEEILKAGGSSIGGPGYSFADLVGVEIVEDTTK